MNLKIFGNNPEQLYVYHKENNLDHHHVTLEKSSCVMRLIIAVSGSGVHTYHYTDDLLRLHCLHWLHWPLLTGSIIYTGAPLMGPNAPLPWHLYTCLVLLDHYTTWSFQQCSSCWQCTQVQHCTAYMREQIRVRQCNLILSMLAHRNKICRLNSMTHSDNGPQQRHLKMEKARGTDPPKKLFWFW